MQVKHILLVVIISLLVSFCAQSALRPGVKIPVSSSTYERVMTTKTLRCAYISYPPYFNVDPNTHKFSGLFYDLMEKVGAKLSLKIEWTEEVGWGTMIDGLKAGRYDAVCSNVWQNATRAVHVDFSQPIGYATVDAWVRADDSRFVNDIASFDKDNVRLSTIDGEMGDILARELFPKAKRAALPQITSFSDVLMQVASGKGDVAIAEPAIVADFLKTNPGTLRNVTAGNPVAIFPITVMLPKGDAQLKSLIDAAIEEIIYTRQLDAIMAKYKMDNNTFLKPARPF